MQELGWLRGQGVGAEGLEIRVDGLENAVVLVGKEALQAEALGGKGGLGAGPLDVGKGLRPLGKGRLVLQRTGSFHSK